MGIEPNFTIEANTQDVTDAIKARFGSLTITDRSGLSSDALVLHLDDSNDKEPLDVPPTGAELRVSLGYDGNVQDVGMYVVDRIEMQGWPQVMVIHGHAAIWDATPAGKTDLQSQKNRSWKAGQALGHVIAVIASEHGMTASVDASLASITLPLIAQQNESDLHLIMRLAKRYDAIAKPAAGQIIVAKRGSGTAANGTPLPTVTIDAGECESFHFDEQLKKAAGTVVAYYDDAKGGKTHNVTLGNGSPIIRLKMHYPDQATALAAAKSELRRRERAKTTLRLSTSLGRPDAFAEAPLQVTGFRSQVLTDWIITSVVHRIGGDAYTTDITAEIPNSATDPNVTDTPS